MGPIHVRLSGAAGKLSFVFACGAEGQPHAKKISRLQKPIEFVTIPCSIKHNGDTEEGNGIITGILTLLISS